LLDRFSSILNEPVLNIAHAGQIHVQSGGIIVKFNLEFPYDADIEKIRKIIE
jgi:hypothetical protein